ncbi:hypothetical protein EGO51_03025 [Haloarcula hispanica]|uniref:Uncharacterized protein n=1 Tax=Haloarcula hispanica TaxID=51589 RepID=A0A5J5LGA7_HALHI|nr:hypothetical protein EGO51_03025 [Haloarcula hispanica]
MTRRRTRRPVGQATAGPRSHSSATRKRCGHKYSANDHTAIVAIENQCTPDRTMAVRSVYKSFQLLL